MQVQLAIPQNLFVGCLFLLLSQKFNQKIDFKILVPTWIERNILLFLSYLFNCALERVEIIPLSRYKGRYHVPVNDKVIEKSIERKRGSQSHFRTKILIKNLQSYFQSGEFNLLQNDYEDISVLLYNRHTYIAQLLKTKQRLAMKTFVFESANLKGAICVHSDLNNENGHSLRCLLANLIFDTTELTQKTLIFQLKTIRFLSFFVALAMRGGAVYYTKRFMIRLVNIAIFNINNRLPKENLGHPDVLLALQIEQDSEIQQYGSSMNYRNEMVKFAISETCGDSQIVIRPHPKDYTFGWIKIYIHLRRLGKRVIIQCPKDGENLLNKFQKVITYSSNIVRESEKFGAETKFITIKKQPSLAGYDINDFIYFEGLL